MNMITKEGFVLVKEEDLHKLKSIAEFLPAVRASISKTWRLIDKLDKMLLSLEGKNDTQRSSDKNIGKTVS